MAANMENATLEKHKKLMSFEETEIEAMISECIKYPQYFLLHHFLCHLTCVESQSRRYVVVLILHSDSPPNRSAQDISPDKSQCVNWPLERFGRCSCQSLKFRNLEIL